MAGNLVDRADPRALDDGIVTAGTMGRSRKDSRPASQESSDEHRRPDHHLPRDGGPAVPPPPEFAAQANAKADLYERAAADPEAFWLETAKEMLTWSTEPTQGCDRSNPPFFTWFADGTLNVSVNCLDRHLESRGDRVAFHWEGEPGDRLEITYRDLHERVCRLANGLRAKGVSRGDRVAIYLGMVPEIVVAMLACARIGAPHTVVFGGFSPDSLATASSTAAAPP